MRALSPSRRLCVNLIGNDSRFRVTNFRSVSDSGWLEADEVTALIGVNESGKTNLLLPLWNLKPAQDGEIQPTSDYPNTMFGEIRNAPGNYHFIEADFDTGASGAGIARAAGVSAEIAETVRVTGFFDGQYDIEFPKHQRITTVKRESLAGKLTTAAQALKKEVDLQPHVVQGLKAAADALPDAKNLSAVQLHTAIGSVDALIPEEPAKTSIIVPMVRQLSSELGDQLRLLKTLPPDRVEGVEPAVVDAILPLF